LGKLLDNYGTLSINISDNNSIINTFKIQPSDPIHRCGNELLSYNIIRKISRLNDEKKGGGYRGEDIYECVTQQLVADPSSAEFSRNCKLIYCGTSFCTLHAPYDYRITHLSDLFLAYNALF